MRYMVKAYNNGTDRVMQFDKDGRHHTGWWKAVWFKHPSGVRCWDWKPIYEESEDAQLLISEEE